MSSKAKSSCETVPLNPLLKYTNEHEGFPLDADSVQWYLVTKKWSFFRYGKLLHMWHRVLTSSPPFLSARDGR